ncbi:MAG: hypothetical protein ACKVQT_06110 [Burkholderiales bacterium]
MDILSHGLWALAGGEVLRRRGYLTKKALGVTVLLAVLPDLIQLIPVIAWCIWAKASMTSLVSYALAVPATEPRFPDSVMFYAYHLYFAMHSVIAVGLVTLVTLASNPRWVFPLLGWWLHIAIDVPTHSHEYYMTPFLYPLTNRGFDGVPWNTPWLLALDVCFLLIAGVWVLRRRS